MFTVRKTFPHSLGLSCAFRQWRAASHCRFLHGYALEVSMLIVAVNLSEENWTFDFGQFTEIKQFITKLFDHKTIVASDDPELSTFQALHNKGVIDLVVLPAVGCEMFSKHIYDQCRRTISRLSEGRASLEQVTVREHTGNEATYIAN